MNILEQANDLIHGVKADQYGDPNIIYKHTAKAWQSVLGFEISPREVVLCLIAMKVVREMIQSRPDNLVDIAGYAGVLEKMSG